MKNFKFVTRSNLNLIQTLYKSFQIRNHKNKERISESLKYSKSFNEGLLTAYLLLESENKDKFIEEFRSILENSNNIEESLRQLERKL